MNRRTKSYNANHRYADLESNNQPPLTTAQSNLPTQTTGISKLPNSCMQPSTSLPRNQKPKLSNKELDSGSSNTLGGGWCPPDFISNGNVGIGRSATTRELRLRSIALGSGPPILLNIVGAGRRNSQLRTVTKLAHDRSERTRQQTEI
jgi:hypothetical protein